MNKDVIRRMPHPDAVARMSTEELREVFLVSALLVPGCFNICFTDLDRLVAGGVVPLAEPLALENCKEAGGGYFLERRELGAFNIGGPGRVEVDGASHSVESEACIYIGKGSKKVAFSSVDACAPARFLLLSCPAHATFPTAVATAKEANTIPLGSSEAANRRVIRQYIHEKGIPSCQLVMGFTELAEGSVWNTFPPHTHNRRTEIYFYYNLGDRVLSHFMGEPQETRHLFVQNEEAVLSPSWSIHSGCGQGNYKFIWGMAGENQRFDDMDAVQPKDLR